MTGRKRKIQESEGTWIPAASGLSYAQCGVAGSSSSNPILLDSPPPLAKAPAAKRQRKTKNSDAPPPEKRGAIFKRKCPQNILERLERVNQQRFFMVDRTRNGKELKEEFQVLGSTGNIYTVTIDKKPSCNCPDASKGNHCKHILFIYAKVLQVAYTSHIWYQKALLTSELEEVFANAPLAPNDIAHQHIREAYAKATGKTIASGSAAGCSDQKRRIPEMDTDCPICYEDMHGVAENKLSFCESCGNCLHNACFSQWAKTKGSNLTCVYCRAKWSVPGVASGSARPGARTSEGYVNLASVAGVSPRRDTSSYYHGPTRGYRHYGYQTYDDGEGY